MNPPRRTRGSRAVALGTGLLIAVVVSLAISFFAEVVPAFAAAPANDDISGAVPITAVPFVAPVDTSEATAVRSDGECVGGGSVWYRFRPTTTRLLRAVTVGSDYDTVLAVFQGRRDSRRLVACNDDAVNLDSALQMRFEAGRRYWIAVSTCCSRVAPAAGGNAVLTLYRGVPVDMSLSVDTVESGAVSGRLLVNGTVECATPSLVGMVVRASQRNGDTVARGTGRLEVDGCTSGGTTWQVRVDSRTGWAFRPGTVFIDVQAFVFDGFGFDEQVLDTTATVVDNPTARPIR